MRSRTLPLTRNGISGPLLIPSISSKGFPIVNGISEAGDALILVSPDLHESLLVSAYDIHHKLVPDHEKILEESHTDSLYGTPDLLVIDSGGYELSGSFESGETSRGPYSPKPFSRADFERVVDQLPKDRELLVVTYDEPVDERMSYREQRQIAQQFATDRPHLKVTFLIKPAGDQKLIRPEDLAPEVRDLRIFDAIGVTEKELGDSILDRLICLATLRRLLDESGSENVPIHVFGSLDPILTPLYFMAGGEIFDGLSWLRYTYYDDCAIHPEEFAVLTVNIDANQIRRDARRHMSNLQYLRKLQHNLERWANDPERYEVLGRHREKIREVCEVLKSRLTKPGRR